MEYFIVKSGLVVLDTARAYGMAQFLQVLAEGRATPMITDHGGAFVLSLAVKPNPLVTKTSDLWKAVFADKNWQRVFLTYKAKWVDQREKVKKSLETNAERILTEAGCDGLAVRFDGGLTLPGALDPAGFKGLKGLTAGNYLEGATTTDELNWALGCSGAAVAQRYKVQKAMGNKWEYYVTLPIPEEVRFSDFHDIRQLAYDKGLSYTGVRCAATHFSLLLADAVRQRAQGNPHFPARFSSVLYFSLFQSGQQYKPSSGGVLTISKLVEIALNRPDAALELFNTWDYLFRRGSTRGSEDLAHAITELVSAPSIDGYYRHARIFLRYVIDRNKGVKRENLYSDRALVEVMNYVQP